MCNESAKICRDEEFTEEPPRLDVRDDQLGDGHSGFVIVRLSRELAVDQSKDLRTYAEKKKLGALVELLAALGNPPTRRLITSVPFSKLLEMEKEAAHSPWRPSTV